MNGKAKMKEWKERHKQRKAGLTNSAKKMISFYDVIMWNKYRKKDKQSTSTHVEVEVEVVGFSFPAFFHLRLFLFHVKKRITLKNINNSRIRILNEWKTKRMIREREREKEKAYTRSNAYTRISYGR